MTYEEFEVLAERYEARLRSNQAAARLSKLIRDSVTVLTTDFDLVESES